MRFENSFVPYGAYWSTPFAKWQGSLSHLHALTFAADVARSAMDRRGIDPATLDGLVLGTTVPQKRALYATPWTAALVGAPHATGTMISQACATGARVLATAAMEIEASGDRTVWTLTADRCSNGPHLVYPHPLGPGGTVDAENWVMDSFGNDPWARNSMLQTAENVAAEAGISREEQDACAVVRDEQYRRALADDRAFQKRYMDLPLEVKDARGKKVVATLETDEGVFPTTAEGLAKLRPVMPEGTVTFGSQTHPADGNCGMIVTTRDRARELSKNAAHEIQVLSYGQGRVKKGFMAMATVPAAKQALDAAGLGIADVDVVKTHNPFAVNDVYFGREMGLAIDAFNDYGSSLVFGHPQGPTGTRLIIEMIEQLAMRGGGHGLFVGCAAGDSAAAIVVKVGA